MNKYKEIANAIIFQKMIIGDTKYSNSFKFVEAKHKEFKIDEQTFYENVMQKMKVPDAMTIKADSTKRIPWKKTKKAVAEVVDYCKSKIKELDNNKNLKQIDIVFSEEELRILTLMHKKKNIKKSAKYAL